jgi:formate transporter
LVTGNFALVPLGVMDRKITMANLWFNWSWVFLGNLIGGILYVAHRKTTALAEVKPRSVVADVGAAAMR